jgi:hypothetical protein
MVQIIEHHGLSPENFLIEEEAASSMPRGSNRPAPGVATVHAAWQHTPAQSCFHAYYGGFRPHPAELPGRPPSSWSTGPKPIFPQKSLWAHHGSSLLMSLCRNNYGVRLWTSSMNVDGERRSEMHGTTKRSGATTNSSCIVKGK